MNKIYFIMWVSWSWKWTLIKNLQKLNKNEIIYFPLSYKSRPKRESELDWIDAKFISKEKFENMIDNWEFLEYAKVHNMHYYGTSLKDIHNWINSNKIIIKELDMNWLEKIRNNNFLKSEYQTIFLSIDEDNLKQRVEKRGDYMTQEELQNRLNSARNEIKKAREYCEHIIDANQNEEEILKNVVSIIVKEIKREKEEYKYNKDDFNREMFEEKKEEDWVFDFLDNLTFLSDIFNIFKK